MYDYRLTGKFHMDGLTLNPNYGFLLHSELKRSPKPCRSTCFWHESHHTYFLGFIIVLLKVHEIKVRAVTWHALWLLWNTELTLPLKKTFMVGVIFKGSPSSILAERYSYVRFMWKQEVVRTPFSQHKEQILFVQEQDRAVDLSQT